MSAPVILVEAQPARASDGVLQTVRLAGGGNRRAYRYANEQWRAGISALPTIISALGIQEGDYGTGAVPQALTIEWSPPQTAALAELAALFWADAPVSVRIGPEGSLPPVEMVGRVLEAPVERNALKITMADPAAALRKPLLSARFAGTGDLEGPTEWVGRIKSRLWGRFRNVAAEPVDPANNIYVVGDPARPLEAIDIVRDKGAQTASLDQLAWQGSIAATLAALRAAVVPQGGGIAAPSISCVRWWTQPAGDLTVDGRGENAGGYVETAPAIAARLVAEIGGPALAAGTLAAAVALRPDPAGWVVEDDRATVAEMLDQLLGDVSLLWVLDAAGTISLRPWAWGASVAQARSIDVERKQVYRPLGTCTIGYRRNHNVMARGELAAIVLAGGGVFVDGVEVTVPPTNRDVVRPPFLPIGGLWQESPSGQEQRYNGPKPRTDAGPIITDQGEALTDGYVVHRDIGIDAAAGLADSAIRSVNVLAGEVDELADAVLAIDDDDVLSISEKVERLIPAQAGFEAFWSATSDLAVAAGLAGSAAYADAAAARSAFLSYLAAINPAWNDISVASPIVRGTLDAVWEDYDDKLKLLQRLATEGLSQRHEQSAYQHTFLAAHGGALLSGQVPKTFKITRRNGAADVSADATWSIESQAGIIGTVTVSSTGNVEIPAGASVGLSGTLVIRSILNGIPRLSSISWTRSDAPAPPATGGGSGDSDFALAAVNSTSWTTVSKTMAVNTGSTGKLSFTTPVATSVLPDFIGVYPVEFRWRYRPVSGSWTNGAVVETGVDAEVVNIGTWSEPELQANPGALVGHSPQITGLATNAAFEAELQARRTSASPAADVYLSAPSGVTVTGS